MLSHDVMLCTDVPQVIKLLRRSEHVEVNGLNLPLRVRTGRRTGPHSRRVRRVQRTVQPHCVLWQQAVASSYWRSLPWARTLCLQELLTKPDGMPLECDLISNSFGIILQYHIAGLLHILAKCFGKVNPVVWPDAWNLIPNPSIRSFDAVASTKGVVFGLLCHGKKE